MRDPVEYEEYLVPALFEPCARELINRAKVWKGDRVLDVACGTGIVARRIAGTGAKVTAIDTDAAALEVARRAAQEESVPVTWHERPAEALQLKAASFDLVTCHQGLQWMTDRGLALREMRRVLASGGRAAIACWAAASEHPALVALEPIAQRAFGGTVALGCTLGDAAELQKLLTAAKFFAIQIETVKRIVKMPDPPRYARMMLRSAAAHANAEPPTDELVAEALAALEPLREGDRLVFPAPSLIAMARVPA